MHELQKPAGIDGDDGATEMVRFWLAHGKPHVALLLSITISLGIAFEPPIPCSSPEVRETSALMSRLMGRQLSLNGSRCGY